MDFTQRIDSLIDTVEDEVYGNIMLEEKQQLITKLISSIKSNITAFGTKIANLFRQAKNIKDADDLLTALQQNDPQKYSNITPGEIDSFVSKIEGVIRKEQLTENAERTYNTYAMALGYAFVLLTLLNSLGSPVQDDGDGVKLVLSLTTVILAPIIRIIYKAYRKQNPNSKSISEVFANKVPLIKFYQFIDKNKQKLVSLAASAFRKGKTITSSEQLYQQLVADGLVDDNEKIEATLIQTFNKLATQSPKQGINERWYAAIPQKIATGAAAYGYIYVMVFFWNKFVDVNNITMSVTTILTMLGLTITSFPIFIKLIDSIITGHAESERRYEIKQRYK